MSKKIIITLHHYLDENDKIMSREELNNRIVSMQKDNEKLKKCVEFYASGSLNGDLELLPEKVDLWAIPEKWSQRSMSDWYSGKLARQTLKEIEG